MRPPRRCRKTFPHVNASGQTCQRGRLPDVVSGAQPGPIGSAPHGRGCPPVEEANMSTMVATPGLSPEALAGVKRRERRRLISGLLFSSPFWLGFLLFTAVPMLASVYLSLTNYGVLTAPKW